MEPVSPSGPEYVLHRAQVGVECPLCHWKYVQEIHLDGPVTESPVAREIRKHLEAWLGTHCPDHLGAIAQLSKN
jgi:hypothetical protein